MSNFNISDKLVNLNDYKLNKIIGKGTFGIVFEATEKKTKRSVAIKVIVLNDILSTKRGQRNVIQELTIPIKINFPGIVKLYGFRFPLTETEKKTEKLKQITMKDEEGKDRVVNLTGAIFVTQYMPNGSLEMITQSYLKNEGKVEGHMNPTIRSKIIYGVASTMEKIHRINVIHRDLKLQNIFMDDNYEPRIADFGSSKVILDGVDMTQYVGTPICMAPELFMETDVVYSFPVDVYSFAFVVYKMFSNKIAFPDKKPIRNQQVYMMKIGNGDRPIKPDLIPDCYWELVQKCWDQAPNKRPKFKDIVKMLRNDKFAINEFGMKTDLDELHEYQDRIDKENEDDGDGDGEVKNGKIKLEPDQKWKNRKNKFKWSRH